METFSKIRLLTVFEIEVTDGESDAVSATVALASEALCDRDNSSELETVSVRLCGSDELLVAVSEEVFVGVSVGKIVADGVGIKVREVVESFDADGVALTLGVGGSEMESDRLLDPEIEPSGVIDTVRDTFSLADKVDVLLVSGLKALVIVSEILPLKLFEGRSLNDCVTDDVFVASLETETLLLLDF